MRDSENRKVTGGSKTDFRIPKMIMGITILVFGAAMIASLFILKPSGSRQVEIVQDGQILYTFDLDFTKTKILKISYENGSSNTITIRDGEIWVSEAECPDQTCVKMGKLRSEHLPIVCMPNRLIIRFREDGS